MSEQAQGRFGRLRIRRPGSLTERDWERSPLLEPQLAPRHPELVSDGAGLPFSLAVLDEPSGQLDVDDSAVVALIGLVERNMARDASKASAERPNAREPPAARSTLDGWREAARTDDEVLFARGRPPQLLTVCMRRESRRREWTCLAITRDRPLRTTRGGIRASGWRTDPTNELDPEQTILRVLVTEQTWAGGKRATGRLLNPNLYVGADELVLTMFVTPRQGYQVRSPNPDTPARVVLPGPVGTRLLIDGALPLADSPPPC